MPPSIIIDSDLDYDEYEEEEVGWGQETCWITDVWTNKRVVSATDASSPEIIYLKMTASCKICISVVQSEL